MIEEHPLVREYHCPCKCKWCKADDCINCSGEGIVLCEGGAMELNNKDTTINELEAEVKELSESELCWLDQKSKVEDENQALRDEVAKTEKERNTYAVYIMDCETELKLLRGQLAEAKEAIEFIGCRTEHNYKVEKELGHCPICKKVDETLKHLDGEEEK